MICKKTILWTITWLIFVSFSAQAQGWERAYYFDTFPNSIEFEDILDVGNDEHVLIGFSDGISLIKINELGDTLWVEKKDASFNPILSGSTVSNNGIVYVTISGASNQSKITEVDLNGNTLWDQTFPSKEIVGDIIQSIDNGFIMVGERSIPNTDSDSIRLTKFDATGNLIWKKKYFGSSRERGRKVVESSDGSIIIAGIAYGSDNSLILLKLNANGDIIWKNYYPVADDDITTSIILSGNNDLIVAGNQSISRYDESGNLLWMKNSLGIITDIKELSNDNLVLTTHNVDSTSNGVEIGFYNLTPAGDENWKKTYTKPFIDHFWPKINCTADGGFLIGFTAVTSFPQVDFYPMVYKVNSLGELYNSQILGKIWNDENDDCLNTADETYMEGWIVTANSPEYTFYGVVDNQGTYQIQVDTGSYTVSVLEPYEYWEPCMDSILQEVMPRDTIEIDFPMQGIVDCPLLTVDIASGSLLRCFDNTYYVNYCNDGTVAAEDAFIEIDFDLDLHVDSASLMWSTVNGNTYTFELGDLPINTCGNFEVYTTLDPDCNTTILGETHCVEAHIFPDSFCLFDPAWDESSIEVDAVCDGDSIRFQITNIGEAPMSEALEYIVIEDNVMRQMGDFDLAPGQTIEIPFASTGATVRLEAAQAAGHPGESMPNVTVEGCDPDGDGIFSLGYYTQWPDDDGSPQISIECLENVGSYDPNDKAATPEGVTENHYIRQNIDIEYKIRFQNIGTGDAMTVVVLDTLSPFLDVSTLELGASSHRYQFEILTNNVLKFTFEEINLPPESVNESASQGFVKFRISQVVDNPIGTIIYNSASIFFDRNQPIITNTTYHEIGEDFIEIIIVSTKEESLSSEFMKITPNPFRQTTLITLLEGKEQDDYSLKILNSIGQVVREDKFSGLQYSFQRNNLGAGLYIFNIEKDNNLVAMGKIIIQ